ncbi:hypothetical protein [Brevibacillus borstelensis]|uniref:hypothetical protein n=1 Tax=Brevibacillus borstelensis TaxID=45462 RepID=UPI001C116626|nr:hypothetical protein [Brevibacillus borstelensis]MCM3592650.1 hypothetical protein [Brevibacillus borstelensis]MED1875179.1 hypothetical protein [Brevibacillus borstelensis]WNF06386.1 hypothetical protein RFB14_02795 [Brevibacillus borstelensis]
MKKLQPGFSHVGRIGFMYARQSSRVGSKGDFHEAIPMVGVAFFHGSFLYSDIGRKIA